MLQTPTDDDADDDDDGDGDDDDEDDDDDDGAPPPCAALCARVRLALGVPGGSSSGPLQDVDEVRGGSSGFGPKMGAQCSELADPPFFPAPLLVVELMSLFPTRSAASHRDR